MDLAHSAMAYLAHERDGLQPAEAFLDPLSLSLAQSIPGMSGGAAINRASAALAMFCATCGVTLMCRHSFTKPRVSYPLSPSRRDCSHSVEWRSKWDSNCLSVR